MSSYLVRSKFGSRAVAATMLLSMLAVGIGVPLYPVVARRADPPYPCRDCACSCSSATACWSGCCCHTDEEKLAWAEENGVTPPAWFLKEVSSKPVACRPASSSSRCCSKAKPRPSAKEDNGEPSTRRVMLSWKVRQCHGLELAPGNEPAYHQVFHMMRDLYRTVSMDDLHLTSGQSK